MFKIIACLVLSTAACSGQVAGDKAVLNKSSAPTSIPTSALGSVPGETYTSSSYADIVNGQQWPTSFRPFAATAIYNIGTAGHSQNTGLTAILKSRTFQYLSFTENSAIGERPNDYGLPVYTSSLSDPVVTITCTGECYNNPQDWSPGAHVPSLTAHIPAAAQVGTDGDHTIAVIQPDGNGTYPNGYEVLCWQFTRTTLTTASGTSCIATSIINNSPTGLVPHSTHSAGEVEPGGLFRWNEIAAGIIPHGFYLTAPCAAPNSIPPAQGSDGHIVGALPEGAWIHLDLTDAQIAALPPSSGLKPILTALAQYGGFLLDTADCKTNALPWSSGLTLWVEDYFDYASFGQPYPNIGGTLVDWNGLRNNFEVLKYP